MCPMHRWLLVFEKKLLSSTFENASRDGTRQTERPRTRWKDAADSNRKSLKLKDFTTRRWCGISQDAVGVGGQNQKNMVVLPE